MIYNPRRYVTHSKSGLALPVACNPGQRHHESVGDQAAAFATTGARAANWLCKD
jgi:hypothetical protein